MFWSSKKHVASSTRIPSVIGYGKRDYLSCMTFSLNQKEQMHKEQKPRGTLSAFHLNKCREV